MGIGDIFKTNEYKSEIEKLREENQRLYTDNCNLHNMLTPEMQNAQSLQSLITDLEAKKRQLEQNISLIEQDIGKRVSNIQNLDYEIAQRQTQIIELDD